MGVFAGIDVAKASLAVALYPGQARLEVGNDAKGHASLCRWLWQHGVERTCWNPPVATSRRWR